MAYYQDHVTELERIRAAIKHNDPENVDLDHIRGFLGLIRWDLEVLGSLKRPDSYILRQLDGGLTEITIVMTYERGEAEDVVQKLWLDLEPPVSDASLSGLPTPSEPAVTPRSPLE